MTVGNDWKCYDGGEVKKNVKEERKVLERKLQERGNS